MWVCVCQGGDRPGGVWFPEAGVLLRGGHATSGLSNLSSSTSPILSDYLHPSCFFRADELPRTSIMSGSETKGQWERVKAMGLVCFFVLFNQTKTFLSALYLLCREIQMWKCWINHHFILKELYMDFHQNSRKCRVLGCFPDFLLPGSPLVPCGYDLTVPNVSYWLRQPGDGGKRHCGSAWGLSVWLWPLILFMNTPPPLPLCFSPSHRPSLVLVFSCCPSLPLHPISSLRVHCHLLDTKHCGWTESVRVHVHSMTVCANVLCDALTTNPSR